MENYKTLGGLLGSKSSQLENEINLQRNKFYGGGLFSFSPKGSYALWQ